MKKLILLFVIPILLSGCGNKELDENVISNISKEKEITVEFSEDTIKFIELIKKEMVYQGYLDGDRLKSFDITRIYKNGHYKKEPNKFHYQINFLFECTDNTLGCVDFKRLNKPTKDTLYNTVIWVYGNQSKIDKLSSGISIGINDNYVIDSEFLN